MTDPDIRPPAVAGFFYPEGRGELRRMVEGLLDQVDAEAQPQIGSIAPHAGLVYSGQCAAHVFKRTAIPEIVVILAPNHTGLLGTPGGASLWARGEFETPLGSVPIAEHFAERLAARCSLVAHDPAAHRKEHAVEIELPFLRILAPHAAIVPIVLAWDDWGRCQTLAGALAETIEASPATVLLMASSDMTHYESAARAAQKDRLALDAVESIDGKRLLDACHTHGVTMCGRAPAAVVLETARRLGTTSAAVVDYRHSGWVTGDDSSVVAYAGVVMN